VREGLGEGQRRERGGKGEGRKKGGAEKGWGDMRIGGGE